ncbi:MAG: hypothetical protein ABI645_13870 [Pseudomonadota bacterium]
MKTIHLRTVSLLVLACCAVPARAADDDIFKFDAFGTLGVVHSSEDQADFTRTILVSDGAGASQEWSPKVDSVLAGQVTANFTPRLSALVQVVSEVRPDDSFDPRIEWANVTYQITPDLQVAAGRIVSPILMLTDTRRLSYSYPWIRPPQEVYELDPVTSNDGVSLHWRIRFGEFTHTLEAAYGRSDTHYSRDGLSGVVRARKQVLMRSTLERGPLSFNIGFGPSELTLPGFAPLFDAFRQFGPAGEDIADRYSADHRGAKYLGTGAGYDPGRWFIMGEWTEVKVKGVLNSHSGWYASAGLRQGALTPYITWAETHPSRKRSDPGLDLTMLPSASVPLAAALNAQLNLLLANAPDQDALSVGVRWDFARNLCLKVQYDHIDLAPGNVGTLTGFQPGFRPGGKVNLLGLSLSFVL